MPLREETYWGVERPFVVEDSVKIHNEIVEVSNSRNDRPIHPTFLLDRVPGTFPHEIANHKRKFEAIDQDRNELEYCVTVSRRESAPTTMPGLVRTTFVANVKEGEKIFQKLETFEQASELDTVYAFRIDKQTQDVLDKSSPLCYECCQAECWGSCFSSNPFNVVAVALKHQRKRLPGASYWAQERLCTMIATWSLRMFNSYNSHRECKKDMENLASLLLHDVQMVVQNHLGTLYTILFGPSNQHKFEDLNNDQVLQGLGAIERDFEWIVMSKRGTGRWNESKINGQPLIWKKALDRKWQTNLKERLDREHQKLVVKRSSKRHLAQKNGKDVPSKRSQLTSVPEDSLETVKQLYQDTWKLEMQRTKAASRIYNTLSAKPTMPFVEPPRLVSPTGSSTSSRTRLPDTPIRTFQTAAQRPTVEGTNSRTYKELVNASQIAAQQPTNGGASPRTYEELANQPTPQWAVVYEAGHLADLGLTAGNYNIVITAPDRKQTVPEAQHMRQNNPKNNPSYPWAIYAILSRVPGVWMSTQSLHKIITEWCPKLDNSRSMDHSFTENTRFYKEKKRSAVGWRLANVVEKYAKAPGGQKKTEITTDSSSKSKRVQKKRSSNETQNEAGNSLPNKKARTAKGLSPKLQNKPKNNQ